MNETIYTEPGKYDPALDIFGPNNFIPFHCYTADPKKKYESPIIGYIDNGNEITNDILTQLEQVFKDQTYLKDLVFDLDDFLTQFGDFFNPLTLLTKTDDDDSEEDKKEAAEAE